MNTQSCHSLCVTQLATIFCLFMHLLICAFILSFIDSTNISHGLYVPGTVLNNANNNCGI